MKRIALVLLLVVTPTLGGYLYGATQSPLAEFKVTIKTTDRGAGFKITCERGCAWKELSYGCGDGKAECTAMVDAKSVGGVR